MVDRLPAEQPRTEWRLVADGELRAVAVGAAAAVLFALFLLIVALATR